MKDKNFLSIIKKILPEDDSSEHKLFLVGGIVRDIFLGKIPEDRDVDLVVEGDAQEFARKIQAKIGGKLEIFPDFGTAKISGITDESGITELDFASTRKEIYLSPGKLPQVELVSDIKADLSRRDFSINALALEAKALARWADQGGGDLAKLVSSTLDLFSGISDLKNREIKILHPESFLDDPTRIFRAGRYTARLEGKLNEDTFLLLNTAVTQGTIATISKQRILNELKKILLEEKHFDCLALLAKWGVLGQVEILPVLTLQQFLITLKKAFASIPASDRMHTFLALAWYMQPEDQREEIFRKYAFGRKSFKEFNEIGKELSAHFKK